MDDIHDTPCHSLCLGWLFLRLSFVINYIYVIFFNPKKQNTMTNHNHTHIYEFYRSIDEYHV